MRRSVQLFTLRCALIVAGEGSFLAASRRLNMHHSALSRRIRDLELALGVKLFHRHAVGVLPTAAGTRFLSNLRGVLEDLDGALSMVEIAGRGESGWLSIGFDAPLPVEKCLDSIVAFLASRPDIELQFNEAARPALIKDLNERAIDLIITAGGEPHGSLAMIPLWRDQVIVATASGSPLASCRTVDPADLARQTVLVNTQSIDLAAIPSLLAEIVQHNVGRECLLKLVRQGLGITLLPENAALNASEGVVFIELHSQGRPVQIRHYARWRLDNSNPVLTAFIAFLRQSYAAS